jgi:hypothetical protein
MTTTELNERLRASIEAEDHKSMVLQPASVQLSPRDLIEQAFAKCESAADLERVAGLVEKLVALEQTAERFAWEREERQSKIDFDAARNRCQKAIGRIAPNVKRNDTNSWWADYAQLDRELRPIYTLEGFSIGYSEVSPIHAGKVRICGTLSRGGVSREFYAEITPTTTGPKGGAMATAPDADAIAMARAKRYILIDMFNVAVGIDKAEKMGITPESVAMADEIIQDWVDALNNAPTLEALKGVFGDCYNKAKAARDEAAKRRFTSIYEALKKEFAEGAR